MTHNNPVVYIDGHARRRRLLGSEGSHFVLVNGRPVRVQATERGYEAISKSVRTERDCAEA